MAQYSEAVKAGEIKSGEGKTVEVNGKPIALFNVDGAYYAIDNTCNHRGGPLGEGDLSGEEVTCPWHGWTYDVKTGNCTSGSGGVKCYAVKVEGESVMVEVE